MTEHWGDFSTSHNPSPKNRRLYCLDANSGEEMWEKEIDEIWRDMKAVENRLYLLKTGMAGAPAKSIFCCLTAGDRALWKKFRPFLKARP